MWLSQVTKSRDKHTQSYWVPGSTWEKWLGQSRWKIPSLLGHKDFEVLL